MPTTHLFVELLVIGFGTLLWVSLTIASLFNLELTFLQERSLELSALFPILSLAYVFGILSDRVADWIFTHFWGDDLTSVYGEEDEFQFYRDRRILVVESPELWQFVEYGRSRLRICRGWALNSVFLAIALPLHAPSLASGPSPLQWVSMIVAPLGLAVLCWLCWKKLNRKELEKIQRQSKWLREHREENKKQEVELTGFVNLGGKEDHGPTDKDGFASV